MKIAIVVGTRPEIIKMAPVIREIQSNNLNFVLIHSNQHYSFELDQIFFEELQLPTPQYNLNIGKCGTHANQIGNILIKIEEVFLKERPSIVLVQGDTNTVVAAALAASKLEIKIAHIEAGLRSYDRTMPEETNRIITDHISDYLFAVTELQKNILLKEGIPSSKISVVGNTIADSLKFIKKNMSGASSILNRLELTDKTYFLMTVHRAANVDDPNALKEILESLNQLMTIYSGFKLVWPVHPRTMKNIKNSTLKLHSSVILTDSLGHKDFMNLLSQSKLVLTDSGGIQEESCMLGIPCVTLRDNTERPETIDIGANILAGRNQKKIISAVGEMINYNRKWASPYGDGFSSEKIINTICKDYKITPSTNSTSKEKINVIGLGYMGLPMACLLAKAGFQVCGYDISIDKVKTLIEGKCPFAEKGMQDLLNTAINNNIFFSNNLMAADVYIIAVPTPEINHKCDTSFVEAAAKSIAKVASNGQLVIVESTVAPSTCENIINPIFENSGLLLEIVFCPERAIPGNTLHEMVHNDRIIGSNSEYSAEKTRQIYSKFVQGNIHKTSLKTAQVVKLMENTYRDINIAYANELHILLDYLDIDVWEAIRLANLHPRVNILNPGPGVGGHCIAVDPWFLCQNNHPDAQAALIKTARHINDNKPFYIVEKIEKLAKINNAKKIAALGLSFKANVDDDRESPAITVINCLKDKGYEVKSFDPHLIRKSDVNTFSELENWADLFVILTAHDEFKKLNFHKPYYDCHNIVNINYDKKNF